MRRGLLAAALLLIHAPLGFGDPVKPDAAGRISADVARLSGDAWQGRRAGTKGADQAADWIAAEFKRIGLTPVDAGSYFQRFTFVDGAIEGHGSRLETAAKTSLKRGVDFRPLAFSLKGSAEGEPVFAGYGIVSKDLGRDDYEGLDVKGRIVVLLRYGPDGNDPHSKWGPFTGLRAKAAAAREKGAKGVLIVTGPRTKGASDELAPQRSAAALVDVGIPALTALRAAVDPLFAAAGTSLDAEQAKADQDHGGAGRVLAGARVKMTADITPKRSTSRNVLGLLEAPSAGEVVVIGAHYDHLGMGTSGSLEASPQGKIHHGADDNASGVSALLELARRLTTNRSGLDRSVLFAAFGAEELGLLGSGYFVRHPSMAIDKITAMINMDMIGRLRDSTLEVHGVGTSAVWRGLVEEAGVKAGLKLRLSEGGFGPSDHNTFYAAGKPILFFFTGTHSDYHKPADTADKVNAAGIVQIVDTIEPIVRGVGKREVAVTFVRVSGDKEQPAGGAARGFKVWVGGIPDYAAPGPGVTFSGVSPGSPAEKAGVQGGDVLMKFAGKEIRDIYEYTAALGDAKPGETVTLVLKRAGVEVTLDVALVERPNSGR